VAQSPTLSGRPEEAAAAAGDTLAADASACPAYARRHGGAGGSTGETTPRSIRARGIGLEAIADVIGDVDIIISSTGSAQPVLTVEAVAHSLTGRRRPLVIIDIAVPRDVDEKLGTLPNVRLLNIDDLDGVVAATLASRQQEIAPATAIVQEEMRRFEAWRQARQVAPTVEHLRTHLAKLAAAEVERYGRRFEPAARDELSRFAQSLMAKVLHPPTMFLTDLTRHPDGLEPPAAADLVRRLFNLDGPEAAADAPTAGSEPEDRR
jgi:glutamyl-tRNA reductase